MEKKNNKSILIGITCLFLVTLVLLGLTYAYYRTRIIGNNSTKPSVSVQSKNMEITYKDGTSSINFGDKIVPGDSFTKTFSVENTGNATVYDYAIVFEELVNEFSRIEDLQYELTCTSNKGNCSGNSGFFPQENEVIVTNSILADDIQTYTLKVSYANSEEDQSVDMNKELTATIDIATE